MDPGIENCQHVLLHKHCNAGVDWTLSPCSYYLRDISASSAIEVYAWYCAI